MLNDELMATLDRAVYRFRDDRNLKVMLIRARGKYFSAGADLMEGSGNGAVPDNGPDIREFHRLGMRGRQRQWDEMEHIEKPFVVAHQGTVVGGGLEMSLSCDFRLAAESARYSLPESKFACPRRPSHLCLQFRLECVLSVEVYLQKSSTIHLA